jgi:hypothetical protein
MREKDLLNIPIYYKKTKKNRRSKGLTHLHLEARRNEQMDTPRLKVTLPRIAAALLFVNNASAFQQSRVPTRLLQRLPNRTFRWLESPSDRCKHPCSEEATSDDLTMDRREAGYALLGQLWAVGVLPSAMIFPESAFAGAEANIQLPNPLEAITDRSTKKCMVESLGNRECLVYEDPENKLYQGTDGRVWLDRIEKASSSFADIPTLVEAKKWSQVTGIMTGPCGDLIRTLGQLAESSDNSDVAKQNVKKLKTSLYAIQAAVDRKQGDLVLKYHKAATDDLVAFVQSL